MNEEMGWAVRSDRVLLNTVSATRRAAIVNHLVTKHGIAITNLWTDDDIERCWTHWGAYSECVQVSICVVVDPIGDKLKSA